MAYLTALGYRVAPFKIGPDFIDPGHHSALTGSVSRNLDSWMLSREYNQQVFAAGTDQADIAVVEGVMGLFDGYSGQSEAGSTAEMAKWLGLPVVLVVNARSMARSAAAVVQGFQNFDRDLSFAGVIFNKTGSDTHYQYLKEAVLDTCTIKPLGCLPRNEKIKLPSRHLGLVMPDEFFLSPGSTAELVSMIDRHTRIKDMVHDLAHIPKADPVKTAGDTQTMPYIQCSAAPSRSFRPLPCHAGSPVIAVARDKAFCFYYQDNIDCLKKNGADIVFFSPLEDTGLPENIHGIYLGGGYPELFARQISGHTSLLKEIKTCSDAGMPIYGECGGFMLLCRDITDMEEKQKFPMAGCFPYSVKMSKKRRTLGYREITLTKDTIIGRKNDVIRGHEFHYSFLENMADQADAAGSKKLHSTKHFSSENPNPLEKQTSPETDNLSGNHNPPGKPDTVEKHSPGDQNISNVYLTTQRNGQTVQVKGYERFNTLGSYLHIHFGSMAETGRQFVKRAKAFKNRKKAVFTENNTQP